MDRTHVVEGHFVDPRHIELDEAVSEGDLLNKTVFDNPGASTVLAAVETLELPAMPATLDAEGWPQHLRFLLDYYVLDTDLGDRFEPLRCLPKPYDHGWPRYLYRFAPADAAGAAAAGR